MDGMAERRNDGTAERRNGGTTERRKLGTQQPCAVRRVPLPSFRPSVLPSFPPSFRRSVVPARIVTFPSGDRKRSIPLTPCHTMTTRSAPEGWFIHRVLTTRKQLVY